MIRAAPILLALLPPLLLAPGCYFFEFITGKACVVEGTRVSTPDGDRPVEGIVPGDRVWCAAPDGTRVEGIVTAVHRGRSVRQIRFDLEDGRALETTPTHLLAAGGGWRRATGIGPDSMLVSRDGPVRVRSVESRVAPRVVYDLTVSPHSNYFAEGVLVHNKSPAPPAVELGCWSGRTPMGTPVELRLVEYRKGIATVGDPPRPYRVVTDAWGLRDERRYRLSFLPEDEGDLPFHAEARVTEHGLMVEADESWESGERRFLLREAPDSPLRGRSLRR